MTQTFCHTVLSFNNPKNKALENIMGKVLCWKPAFLALAVFGESRKYCYSDYVVVGVIIMVQN